MFSPRRLEPEGMDGPGKFAAVLVDSCLRYTVVVFPFLSTVGVGTRWLRLFMDQQ
jgi:hypothetical protein